MSKKKGIILLAVLFALSVMVSGCTKKEDPPPTPSEANKIVKLSVGTNAGFAPFEFYDGEQLAGFDMDLIRAIGEVMGVEVTITHMDFDALVLSLQNDIIDCAIAGMTIDPAKEADFSAPYFDAGLIIAVKKGSPITSTEDLKGKNLAAQLGTTGANYCEQVKAADSTTTVKTFKEVSELFMELNRGSVDAVVNDQAVTINYIDESGTTDIVTVGETFSTEEQYGIAVKKGNTELLNQINQALETLKANGEFQEIYDKWFAK